MKRVLIVDDESDHRLLLRDVLEVNGYACEEAADGVEALAVLSASSVDLILTDLNMPRMNGKELIGRLTDSEGPVMIPIILVTSEDPESIPSCTTSNGWFAILSKPYQWGNLLTAVSEATENTSSLMAISR